MASSERSVLPGGLHHPTEGLLAHEAVHAEDQKRWGVLFYAAYALLPPPWLGFGRACWRGARFG